MSVAVLVQAPLHACWPAGQPQVPALHDWPTRQRTPQPPQLDTSDWVSAQVPLHDAVPAGQPHAPPVQSEPAPQRLLQAPQFLGSVRTLVQPAPQSWVCGGQTQPPPWHTPEPQVVPQPPQLRGSVRESTQRPLHTVCPAWQVWAQVPLLWQVSPALQQLEPHWVWVGPHMVPWQTLFTHWLPEAQAMPQAPQF